jgi:putative salt-induced outer membrane protein
MKFNTKDLLLMTTFVLLAQTAVAQSITPADELGWSGKGEMGLVRTTGNTESEALNFNLEFVKTTATWRHRFSSTTLTTSEDGIQDNERYQLGIQSDRKVSDISYLFSAFRFDADKFGAYDPQTTLTIGYGREFMKREGPTCSLSRMRTS